MHPGPQGGPRVLMLGILDAWMFQNLVPALRRLCGHVSAYAIGNYMGSWHEPRWLGLRRRLMERFRGDLRSLAARDGIDLVLTLQYDDTVRPQDVRLMRDLCGKVVHYHVDMNRQWYRVLRQARLLDLLAVSHMQYLEPFIRRGVPLHSMPMGASPDRYAQPPRSDVPSHGVLMLGRCDPNRQRAVAACRSVTERVDVYGPDWEAPPQGRPARSRPSIGLKRVPKTLFDLRYVLPRVMAEGPLFTVGRRPGPAPEEVRWLAARANIRGYAREEDVPALMANAAVTLGVNQRHGALGGRRGFADSRLRDFEAPLAGAFYLVQWYLDLPHFYRPGVEVETWATLEELKEKVAYYLDRPQERRAIAEAGRRRALAEHTWDARLRTLLARLGLAAREDGQLAPLDVVANLSDAPWPMESPGCMPGGGPGAVPGPELATMRDRRRGHAMA